MRSNTEKAMKRNNFPILFDNFQVRGKFAGNKVIEVQFPAECDKKLSFAPLCFATSRTMPMVNNKSE